MLLHPLFPQAVPQMERPHILIDLVLETVLPHEVLRARHIEEAVRMQADLDLKAVLRGHAGHCLADSCRKISLQERFPDSRLRYALGCFALHA
jgi:hypothetical protein